MDYVIIGNGVASISAIEGIRKIDQDSGILVISAEPDPTYGRPLISYYLSDTIRESSLPLRPESFYEKNKAELRLNTKVVSIDTAAGTVKTDSGETIPYGRLLIATGGETFRPPVENLDGPDVYSFIKKSDAEQLITSLNGKRKIVVIGAGLIGLKAAEGLAMRGMDVTVIERMRLMWAYMDETAGRILLRHLEEQGLKFMEQTALLAVTRDGDEHVTGVVTDHGHMVCDAVILAAGVRPGLDLAVDAGLDVNRGIIVDDSLRTSAPDVFAAGDVAEARDLLTGEPTVIPIWPNAYHQGFHAGVNMAGGDQPYAGTLSMNSIAYFGLPTVSVGLVNPPDTDDFEINVHIDEKNKIYRKLVFQGNRLVGCILIGEVDYAGFYSGFIRFKLDLDSEAKRHLLSGAPSPLDWPEELLIAQMRMGGAEAPPPPPRAW